MTGKAVLRWALCVLCPAWGCSPATPEPSAAPARPDETAQPAAPQGTGNDTSGPAQAEPAPRSAGADNTGLPALGAGQQVSVPGGVLRVGSRPGLPHRNPSAEADGIDLPVPGFRIDRLPYPNDPAQPAKSDVTRDEASRLCAAQDKRLCTDLEWERACKGDPPSPFAGGPQLDVARCNREPQSCLSGFGAAQMGTALREWTAGHAKGGLGHPLRTAITKGATPGSPSHAHRCAARTGATPDSRAKDIGFRCCSGPAPQASYPEPAELPLVQGLKQTTAELRTILQSVEPLAQHAHGFEPQSRADIDRALRRGKRSRGNISAWRFAPPVFAWQPVRGETLWVVSGRVRDKTLLAVLYPMPDDSFAHAASTLIDERDSSVAVGYNEERPRELLWSTCFGCPGEGGRIRLGEDNRIGFEFR